MLLRTRSIALFDAEIRMLPQVWQIAAVCEYQSCLLNMKEQQHMKGSAFRMCVVLHTYNTICVFVLSGTGGTGLALRCYYNSARDIGQSNRLVAIEWLETGQYRAGVGVRSSSAAWTCL